MNKKRKPKGYWIFETCKQEASKYKTRSEFGKSCYQAYDVSRLNGWLDEICQHMSLCKKPRNYWSMEICKEEALKYNRRSDFQENSSTAYTKCVKEGWLDQVCCHMEYINKPKGYWNFENCKLEAMKFSNLESFKKGASTAHRTCTINKWLDEVCSHMNKRVNWGFFECEIESKKFNKLNHFMRESRSCYCAIIKNNWLDLLSHMERKTKPRGYWNKEKCREEALKYTNKKEFQENSSSAFSIIYREGWGDELMSHFIYIKKPQNYWTKFRCIDEALKYNNCSDFRKNSPSAYSASKSKGWYNEITAHFILKGSWYKRFIYAYEFPDNHVYVGLTYNLQERNNDHNLKGSVFDYKQESGLEPVFKKLIKYPVEIDEAVKLEDFYLEDYVSKGWIPLNKAKTGSLGSSIRKWSIDNLQKEALKYNTKKDFREFSSSAYSSAKRLKILDIICEHMNIKKRHPAGYWTKEKCKFIADTYDSVGDFLKNDGAAYAASSQNGWLQELTKHMYRKNSRGEIIY